MRFAFAASHCAKVCSCGLSEREKARSRAPQKLALEVALELEHVAEVVGAGEAEAAVDLGRHGVVATVLAERLA